MHSLIIETNKQKPPSYFLKDPTQTLSPQAGAISSSCLHYNLGCISTPPSTNVLSLLSPLLYWGQTGAVLVTLVFPTPVPVPVTSLLNGVVGILTCFMLVHANRLLFQMSRCRLPPSTSGFRMLPLRPSVKVFWVPAVCPEDAEGKHMCVTWRVPDMSTGRSRSALGA